jgi:1-pyrroline-5-carboxylate dehydrogenase
MFVHKNWRKTDILEKMQTQSRKRNLADLTIGPVLSWNNEQIKEHVDAILELEGAELLFGGVPLRNHTIPSIYGAYEPTAIKVPLKHFRGKKKRDLLTTELFGPFQIVVEYGNRDVDFLVETLENLPHHLTAAIVSNDAVFTDKLLGSTINGTTYHGLRARTTGAPQNHWFGPCGDPRGGGIGTASSIQLVWSAHREIISDIGPIKDDWVIPHPA